MSFWGRLLRLRSDVHRVRSPSPVSDPYRSTSPVAEPYESPSPVTPADDPRPPATQRPGAAAAEADTEVLPEPAGPGKPDPGGGA